MTNRPCFTPPTCIESRIHMKLVQWAFRWGVIQVLAFLNLNLRTGRPPTEVQNPQPPNSARRGAGQKRGAWGSAQKVLAHWVSSRNKGGRALPQAPRFWPAPLRALSRALLGGWGFGRPVQKP